MKQNLPLKRQEMTRATTNKTIFRDIEREAREAEEEIFRETTMQFHRTGKQIDRTELTKVMEKTRKKVYKRPMTAVNAYKQNNTPSSLHKDSFDFDQEKEIGVNERLTIDLGRKEAKFGCRRVEIGTWG